MKRFILLALIALVGCSKTGPASSSKASLAVVTSAPPASAESAAQSAAAGPSLDDTFTLIQHVMMGLGPISWEGLVHDSAPPAGQVADWTYTRSVATSNNAYDLATCTLSFHYRVITNGAVSTEVDAAVPMRQVQSIQVATEAVLVGQRDVLAGHPTWATVIQPPIYDVDVVRGPTVDNTFSFTSQQTANDIAQALQHAAQLCGVNPKTSF